MDTMKDWKPVGSPSIQLDEAPVSFTEIALLAYERKIFTNEKAWNEYLGDIVIDNDESSESPMNIDSSAIVANAIKQSETLSKEGLNVSGLSQSAKILMGKFDGDQGESEADEKDDSLSCSKEDLVVLVNKYKDRCQIAESKVALLEGELAGKETRVQYIEKQLDETKEKLKSSEAAQVNFMAEIDKQASEKKVLVDGISQELFESIKPLIKNHFEANPVKSCCKEIKTELTEIKKNVVRQGVNIVRSQSTIESNADNVEQIISALEGVGIKPSRDIDMPDSVVQILHCFNSMNTDRESSTDVPSTQTLDGPRNFSYVPD